MEKKKKRKKRRGGKLAELFEFPPEVIVRGANLHVFEDAGCLIENYKSILSFSDALIKIETESGEIVLKGKDFAVAQMDSSNLSITGRIADVSYQNYE